ncbi:MAG: alpha/beta hydrolase [Chloroflexota bacterium]|nr:alpha/beta hydrolase [Chloroflexota bacterium]
MTEAGTVWNVPEPLETVGVPVDADTTIIVRRHGNPDGQRLVMSHGNGLAVDLYYPFWSLLTDEFDVIVYDLRNHGWNEVSPLERHNIPTLVSDHDLIVQAIDEHFGAKPKVGVYHSVSSLIALISPTMGSAYSALVMFDPPIRKPNVTDQGFDEAAIEKAAGTRRRATTFRSLEEFSDFLAYIPTFQRMVPGARELMAETTLRKDPDGKGFTLRCPREYEALMTDYARIFFLAVDFESMRCPLKVIGADPTLPFSYLPTLDLSHVSIVHYDFVPDATHFLLQEKPEECAKALREFLAHMPEL